MILRIIFMAVALLVASAAFYSVLSNVFRTKPGWQTIEVRKAKTSAKDEFVFNYKLGEGEVSPSIEWSNLTNDYSEILERNYKIFDLSDYSGISALYELNHNPNVEINIEKELYKALKNIEESGSRYIYFGPVFEIYRGLNSSEDEIQSFEFNPLLNDRVSGYFEECIEFIKDPKHIKIELLGETKARLFVSDEYLKFAKENEIEYFLDFYYWKNAFVLDAVSDALVEKGYRAGIISSVEGFSRALGPGEYAVDKYALTNGQMELKETITYEGPKSVCAYHPFPLLESDYKYYYISEDKTIFTPYLDLDTGLGIVSFDDKLEGQIIYDSKVWGMPK